MMFTIFLGHQNPGPDNDNNNTDIIKATDPLFH